MMILRYVCLVLIAAASLAFGVGAQTAPAKTAPCTVAPQPLPCGSAPLTKPAKPASADPLAFPGETDAPASGALAPNAPPAKAAEAAPPPSDGGVSAPSQAGTAGKGASGLDFPDEDPKPLSTSSAGTSSSSSSSSSSSGDAADPVANTEPGLKDKGSEGNATPGRHLLHRVNPIGTKLQNADDREAEDLDVAHFYTQTGDLQGAYLRSQDAVKTAPEDPEAHYALAEIARKLNKRDEAIAEYNACLKFDPSEKEAKSARKELARLKQ